ncbi:MAG: CoA transferase [Gammaproteobacteria bacterium]|nr:CoA transferase [Gammaproteobacteria bacterium]
MSYLLEDITVIDAATYLAGPGSATILADFGANVIKIEPPGGDGYRTLVGPYPVPYHWQLTSRNKRSVCLDLSQASAREVMHALIQRADVLTTNFLEPALQRYGMTWEELRALNPRLIFAHITGYGTDGPEVERRAFDVTAWWGRSGHMEFIRQQGGAPQNPSPGMGDHGTAVALYGAIMTGLYRREKTGAGSYVATSLLANGVWTNGMALQGVIAGNDLGRHKQEKGWHNPFTGIYRTRDDRYVVLAALNAGKEWPKLCEALSQDDWKSDPRFLDLKAAMKNRMVLIELLSSAIAGYSLEEICQRFDAADVTYGKAMPMGEVVTDPQVLANGYIVPTGDPGEDYRFTVNSPIFVGGESKKPPKRAPDVGAHTGEVLREFGFDDSQISTLAASKAISGVF